MKKIKFLVALFAVLNIQVSAQLLHNKTGYYIDYGASNTTGTGYWNSYSNNSTYDSSFNQYQSNDGLVMQGFIYPFSTPKTYEYAGFVQNRFWDYGDTYRLFSIDMSKQENMSMKVRMKSTGTLTPKNIYVKLKDTLGNITLIPSSLFTINPTSEYEEYYFNFKNGWRDMTKPTTKVVDSSAISGFDFYIELESPLPDLTGIKLEIDYIQLGSYVDWSFNTITGRVYNDNNIDCKFNSTDTPVKRGLITALPGPYYAYTDSTGFYELKVDTLNTSYNLTYTPTGIETELLEKFCPALGKRTVATPKGKSTYCCNDFSQKIKQCAVLKIDINSNRRRRCFTNYTYVSYQNVGNINSKAAEITVVYPEFVEPLSSTPAWTRKNGNTLYYAVGNIAPGDFKSIVIIDSVVCGIEDIRSLTQCTKATISPGNACINEPINWDKADVIVKGKCDKGIAKFNILNEGIGDMGDSTKYRVYANDTLISVQKFALKSQEYFQVELPTNGKAIRLEAEQVANHPEYNTLPRICFEGCVANQSLLKTATKGLTMNVPQNNDLVTATSCMPIVDSYDPNDKAVFPKGKSDKNYISAGTKLDYTIRFENTGSDDAYTVVVVDTLDSDLNTATFTPGNSSHPYSIEREILDEKEIVKFHFKKINLTPKKIDSIKSQGYIKFSILTKADLADGSMIENTANIFFDYNSAIVTNTVAQTIGEYIEEDLTKGTIISRTAVTNITTGISSSSQTQSISVYPNPTNDNVTITFPSGSGNAQITIYAMNGTSVLTKDLTIAADNTISLQQLHQGIYYYKITDSNGLTQNGKIVKQ